MMFQSRPEFPPRLVSLMPAKNGMQSGYQSPAAAWARHIFHRPLRSMRREFFGSSPISRTKSDPAYHDPKRPGTLPPCNQTGGATLLPPDWRWCRGIIPPAALGHSFGDYSTWWRRIGDRFIPDGAGNDLWRPCYV